MIKKILNIQLLGVLLFSANVTANSQSNCDDLTACQKKICHIKKYSNSKKARK